MKYLPKYAQLDKLAGSIVRSRGKCENCGRNEGGGYILTWAHIMSRGIDHMRWDLDNALCLCWNMYTQQGCHPYFTVHPKEWREFLIGYIGEEKYDELVLRSNNAKLMGQFDINEIKFRLQKESKRLKVKVYL